LESLSAGIERRIAKPLYGQKLYRGFESPLSAIESAAVFSVVQLSRKKCGFSLVIGLARNSGFTWRDRPARKLTLQEVFFSRASFGSPALELDREGAPTSARASKDC
jgi:hypothetical protein